MVRQVVAGPFPSGVGFLPAAVAVSDHGWGLPVQWVIALKWALALLPGVVLGGILPLARAPRVWSRIQA